MKNVFIVNSSREYAYLFAEHGWVVVSDIESADLICFTGGEDVSPKLYGEQVHPHTFYSPERDKEEQFIFIYAVEKGIPCVGICRGGQFLNVMNGGKMYQHVSNHTRSHYIKINDNKFQDDIWVSSTHHQMMRPGPASVVLATANEGGFKEYMAGKDAVVRVEGEEEDTEVVFYPNTKSLCFQPHPEFYPESEMANLFFYFVNNYLMEK